MSDIFPICSDLLKFFILYFKCVLFVFYLFVLYTTPQTIVDVALYNIV